MRSIGIKNRNLVVRTTKELVRQGHAGIRHITEKVIEALPERLWDTWEGAHEEIKRLVWDTINGSS